MLQRILTSYYPSLRLMSCTHSETGTALFTVSQRIWFHLSSVIVLHCAVSYLPFYSSCINHCSINICRLLCISWFRCSYKLNLSKLPSWHISYMYRGLFRGPLHLSPLGRWKKIVLISATCRHSSTNSYDNQLRRAWSWTDARPRRCWSAQFSGPRLSPSPWAARWWNASWHSSCWAWTSRQTWSGLSMSTPSRQRRHRALSRTWSRKRYLIDIGYRTVSISMSRLLVCPSLPQEQNKFSPWGMNVN